MHKARFMPALAAAFSISNTLIALWDAQAQTQFQCAIGGLSYDHEYEIIQTTDSGYAMAGYTGSFGEGIRDMYIAKLDARANLQWTKAIGGGNVDVALSIRQASAGGYVVGGISLSYGVGGRDVYIVNLDTGGNVKWSRTIGGANDDYAYSIIQTTDGGYAAGGYTNSFGAGLNDVYIVKLDSIGTLQWSRTIGGTNDDLAFSIVQTTDGGYALAGYTSSFGAGNVDMYIVKLDAGGVLQWARKVGTTFPDLGFSLIQSADGGYAVAGSTGGSNIDMYIVKLDASGNTQWSKAIGGPDNEEPNSIIQTVDSGYAVVGYTFSFGAGIEDTYVVKLDAAGNTCSNSLSVASSSGTGGILGTPASIANSPNAAITAPTPDTSSGGALTTVCVLNDLPASNEIPASFELYQNYPNPFNPITTIEYSIPKRSLVRLEVFDILSQQIATLVDEEQPPGTYKIQWQAKDFPSGIYFYRLQVGSFTETRRLIVLK